MINITDIVEGCRSYHNEAWALLLEKLATETAFPPKREYTSPTEKFRAILYIQNKTTSDAGIEKWGFSELLFRLGALPDKKNLRVEEFDLKAFSVRCVFNSDSPALLGCTIVKKKKKFMQTPPAWDGSLDALEKFNNPPENESSDEMDDR